MKTSPSANADTAARPTLIDLSILLAPKPGGLTADWVAQRAIEVAPQVRKAEATSKHADKTAGLAVAAFVPRIDLVGSYTRWSRVTLPLIQFDPTKGPSPNPFPQILNRYDLRAVMSVPVTDYFLTVMPTYKGAQKMKNAAKFQLQAELALTAMRAKQAFYGYIQAQATVHIAEDSVKLLRAYATDLERLLAAGAVTKADVLQAQTQLAQAEANHARAEGGLAVATTTLRELLDLNPSDPIAIGETIFNTPQDQQIPIEEQVRAHAEQYRPEILALRSIVEANASYLQAKYGSMWPHLTLNAGYVYANPNQRIFPQSQTFTGSWDATAMLSWSPNDAVHGYVDYDAAKTEWLRAQEDMRIIRDQIAIEANRAVQDMRVSILSIEAARRAVASASEGWTVRRELFSVGETTSNDMLIAENILRRSQLDLVDAFLSNRMATAQMLLVTGQSMISIPSVSNTLPPTATSTEAPPPAATTTP